MKFNAIKNRIKLLRESNVQHLLPIDSCMEKMRTAEALVDFIEKQEAETDIIQQAHWYFVIMCVGALEIYFKGMAEIFIQGGWFKDSFLDTLRQEKISLVDFIDMNKEEITLGELLSVSQSFQDLNSINNFYSKMIGCKNFVKEVGEFKAPLGKGQFLILNDKHPTFEKDINNLVHFRHLVIHHDTSKRTLSKKNLDRMIGSLIDFVYATDFYLMEASGGYTEV
ncbi:MAG: hypothetical protein KAW90_04255 [Dehalococcoidales bacterium]|nr:hypothetical protein [Dehalococcoidales bacterium]